MPLGTNFYNALAMARQQTDKLKQQKLAEINAASGALAKERMAGEDRKQRMAELDRNEMLQREQLALQADTRDKGFANALELAKINTGARENIAEQSNLTKKEIEDLKTARAYGVEGMRGERAMDVEGMRQGGANSRLDKTITSKENMGALEREHQTAMQERGIKSREGISAADRASREQIASKRAELEAAKQDALENYRDLTIAEQRADRDQRGMLAQMKQSAYEKYKAIETELKISGDVMLPDDKKAGLLDKLQAPPAGPRAMPSAAPAQSKWAPEADMTDAQDTQDMEPLAQSLSAPEPSPSFGVMQSDRNERALPPSIKPGAAPAPTSPAPATPAGPAAPDLKTKEGRQAHVKNIMRSLVARDKADGMKPEEIAAKNASGAYDREAISMFNAEGMAGKQPVGYVDQLGINRGTSDGKYDNEALASGPGMLAKAAALPGKLAQSTLIEPGLQAVDVATGVPIESMKTALMAAVNKTPMSERERANILAKIASARGTELSQLAESVKGNSSPISGPAVGNAAMGVISLAGGPLLGKLASGAGSLANFVTRGYAGKAGTALTELAKPAISKVGEVLKRPLSDLSGKAAAKAEADAAAKLAAESAAKSKFNFTGQAPQVPDDFANAIRGEINQANAMTQAERDLIEQARIDKMIADAQQQADFSKAIRGEIDQTSEAMLADKQFGLNQPMIPQAPRTAPTPSWAKQATPVDVDPLTGVRTIPMEAPPPPATLPLQDPTQSFAKALAPADEGAGLGDLRGALDEMKFALSRMKNAPAAPAAPAAPPMPPAATPLPPTKPANFVEAMTGPAAPPAMPRGFDMPRSPDFIPFELQKAAAAEGIPAKKLFDLLQSAPFDLLPTADAARTPEGARATILALKAGMGL